MSKSFVLATAMAAGRILLSATLPADAGPNTLAAQADFRAVACGVAAFIAAASMHDPR